MKEIYFRKVYIDHTLSKPFQAMSDWYWPFDYQLVSIVVCDGTLDDPQSNHQSHSSKSNQVGGPDSRQWEKNPIFSILLGDNQQMKFACNGTFVLEYRSSWARVANVVAVSIVADPIFRSIWALPICSLGCFSGFSLLLVYFVQYGKKSAAVLRSSNVLPI